CCCVRPSSSRLCRCAARATAASTGRATGRSARRCAGSPPRRRRPPTPPPRRAPPPGRRRRRRRGRGGRGAPGGGRGAARALARAFVEIAGAVAPAWLACLWLATAAAPLLERWRERLAYRVAWSAAVLATFAFLLQHAMTTGVLHMLEDGLLLATLCQVHLLN